MYLNGSDRQACSQLGQNNEQEEEKVWGGAHKRKLYREKQLCDKKK